MVERKPTSVPLLEAPSVPVIDSSTFGDYLFQEYPESRQFALQLDLGWLTPAIDYLYEQKRPIDLYSGEVRQVLERWRPDEAKRQVSAERSTVLYYDPGTDGYQITSALYGKANSVQLETAKLGQSGKWPLINIHTHPFNALLSPRDYSLLVQNLGSSLRPINAVMALCLDVQVLGLATPQTPRLSGEELELFFDQFRKDVDLDPEIITLKRQEEEIISRCYGRPVRNLLARIYELSKGVSDPEAPPPEVLHEAEGLLNEASRLIEEGLGCELDPVDLRLKNRSEKILNAALLQVARLWNIQLYFSTDKSNFIKFSA